MSDHKEYCLRLLVILSTLIKKLSKQQTRPNSTHYESDLHLLKLKPQTQK